MIKLTPPDESVILLTAAEAAEMFGVAERTWRTWDSGGHVPRPVTIARSKFWRPKELVEWARHGCPKRSIWDTVVEDRTF